MEIRYFMSTIELPFFDVSDEIRVTVLDLRRALNSFKHLCFPKGLDFLDIRQFLFLFGYLFHQNFIPDSKL